MKFLISQDEKKKLKFFEKTLKIVLTLSDKWGTIYLESKESKKKLKENKKEKSK